MNIAAKFIYLVSYIKRIVGYITYREVQMVICFDVDRKTKDIMDQMVSKGAYRDYSELLSVSVANQLLLHSVQATEARTASEPSTTIQPSTEAKPEWVEPVQTVGAAIADTSEVGESPIPKIFLINREDTAGIEFAQLPNDAFVSGMEITADRWIFGQHNKLLPVKANVRALLNLLRTATKLSSVELEEASRQIANEASRLGDVLRRSDLNFKRSRDESIALAFPSSEPSNSDKSRLRYASQFVGSVSREGRMTGLLIDLKLVNIDRHKPPRIRLTEPGLRFAELPNPILDAEAAIQQERFSPEEIDFMLHHIQDHLPVEQFAFSATLAAITDGSNTPEMLDSALKKFLPDRKDKPFTLAFLTTQRAGVISRMADLGLVTRTRSGPNVTYVATERAKQFLVKGDGK